MFFLWFRQTSQLTAKYRCPRASFQPHWNTPLVHVQVDKVNKICIWNHFPWLNDYSVPNLQKRSNSQCPRLYRRPREGPKPSNEGLPDPLIWWHTCNCSLNWPILPYVPTFKLHKVTFLDSQILSDWYHFNQYVLGYKIWKKFKFWWSQFFVINPNVRKIFFCENFFPQTPAVAPNHYRTVTQPRKNIVPQTRIKYDG